MQGNLSRREQNRESESVEVISSRFCAGINSLEHHALWHYLLGEARAGGFLSILLGVSLPFVSICTGMSSEGFYSKTMLVSSGSAPRHPSPGFQGNLSFLSLRITIPRRQHGDPETHCNLAKSLIPQLGLLDLYSQAVDGHCT